MYDYFTELNQYLEHSARCYPNKIALINGKQHMSYDELDRTANQFAHYLLNRGVFRGDRVVATLGNTVESVIVFWGALKIGAIISLISPDITGDKLDYILKDSGASALICTSPQYQDIFTYIQNKAYSLSCILLKDAEEASSVLPTEHFSEALKKFPSTPVVSKALDIDLASIIYTSGSTGEPKGVMLTHRNMLAASTSINQYLGHTTEDIIISALPISFDYGLYQMIMAFSMGATLILEVDFFWPAQFLKKIASFKATVLPVVPSMVPLLEKHGKKFPYDVSSIRCVTNTGAALNLKHIDMLKNQFSAARIFSMYGLTECKRCTYLPPEKIDQKPNSIGIAIPNTELWITDESGQRLGPNQLGQLVIRGATVMKGYWNKPDKTAEKLKDGPIPGEKILYTGDYCWLDEEGYLYFHGRMDEVLKCRGIKVSPKEVEVYLMKHPSVLEAAIIGVEDLDWGTAIHAIVAGEEISHQELQQYCQHGLPSEQQPKFLSILKTLPKSSNGKIDKLALKARFQSEEYREAMIQVS